MAFVNVESVLAETQRLLKKIEAPGGIELLSYKRNRSIAIIKKGATLVEVREDGYVRQVLELTPEQLGKELKTMIKREFPRSRKIRVFKFADPQELARERQKI